MSDEPTAPPIPDPDEPEPDPTEITLEVQDSTLGSSSEYTDDE